MEENGETKKEVSQNESESLRLQQNGNNENSNTETATTASRFFDATAQLNTSDEAYDGLEQPTKIDKYLNGEESRYKISEEDKVWEDREVRFDEGKGMKMNDMHEKNKEMRTRGF